MHILYSGLIADTAELKAWIMAALGKYRPAEGREKMTSDIMFSPPGYTRAQATFGLDGRFKLIFASNCVCANISIGIIYIYIYIYTYIHIHIYILKLI